MLLPAVTGGTVEATAVWFSRVIETQPEGGGGGVPRGATSSPASFNCLNFLYKYDPSRSITAFDFPSSIIWWILQSALNHIINTSYDKLCSSVLSYLDMSCGFFKEVGKKYPLHCNHHLRAGTVCVWNGSFNSAPGISAGVSSTSGSVAILCNYCYYSI